MGELKAHEVERWLASRTARPPVMLLYGPDRGAVSERARRLALESGVSLEDPFAVIRLDAAEVDKDPGRLIDEANTLPMFSGHRLIWIKGAGAQKGLSDAIRIICASPPPDMSVVIEGSDLRKGSGVRAVVEGSRTGIAIPCYADDEKAVEDLVRSSFAEADLEISDEALSAFCDNLGGDRLATRSEIEKIILYARGLGSVSLADVRASSGDVAALSTEDAVDAVLSGDPASFDERYYRLIANGGQAGQVLSSTLRECQMLLSLRVSMDAGGKSASATVAAGRQPVHFSRRKLVEAALGKVTAESLAVLCTDISDAILQSRKTAPMAAVLAHRSLMRATRLFTEKVGSQRRG